MIKTVNNIINDFRKFIIDMFPWNVGSFEPDVKYDKDEITATFDIITGPIDRIRLYITINGEKDFHCEIMYTTNCGDSWWTDGQNLSIIQKDIINEMKTMSKYLNEHYTK